MKFTKLMAVALVFLLLVSTFVACSGETPDTNDPGSMPPADDTPAPDTEPPEPGCDHKGKWKKTGMKKDPTCTEEGYVEWECRSCGEIKQDIEEKVPHTYGEVKSVDGKYIKKVCSVCGDNSVSDAASGAVVEDYSAIQFPIFAADFTATATLAEITALNPGFTAVEAGTFVNIVVTNPNGERYANVPSGNYGANKNGRFELTDDNKALAGGFTVIFDAQYADFPKEMTPLLTWIVDGTARVLLTADNKGNVYNGEGTKIATFTDKGWDNFKVVVAADGTYTVTVTTTKGNEKVVVGEGTGKIDATVTTSSAIKFFDNSSEFEGYLDNIIIQK